MKNLKILSRPQGNAEEYGRWSVNPYKGCPHGCQYCYLKKGAWKKGLGGSVPTLKEHVVNDEHAYHLAMAEIIENREQIIKDGGLFMTFTSDPCIPDTRDLMLSIANDAINMEIPVTMLTKNATFLNLEYWEEKKLGLDKEEDWRRNLYFNHAASKRLSFIPNPHFDNYTRGHLTFGFTLTGHDELEPNASPNAERIKAMQCLKGRGYITWASIEPVIDFPSSLDMIRQALGAGCEHFKVGLLTNNTRVCRSKYVVEECLDFIRDVMVATDGKATVYWKESVRELIRYSRGRKSPLSDADMHTIFDIWPNSVTKDWSIFDP